MSVEQTLDVDVDLDGNEARATLQVAVADLFDEDDELRLWDGDDGWVGYRREQTDGDVAYFFVDTTLDEDDWRRDLRVGERAVQLAVEQRIADPDAGGRGAFVRGVAP